MKPTKISDILDLALVARQRGHIFNPLFTGDAGVGKSAICQQWVEAQRRRNPKFGFLDLRIAYLEAPDLIGFPKEVPYKDTYKTTHCLPDFWPEDGEGLLLIEEPNRGTTGVMNCLMQLLTDRKIHKYTLPEGWVIASAINPDSAEYDVNQMDAALRDRFEEFEINYDHNAFVEYMEANKWHEMLQMFVKSGAWTYKDTKSIKEGGKYISPRTWSKLEAAEKSDAYKDQMFHDIVCRAVLGREIGREYWSFCHQQAPVLANDLLDNHKQAIARLKKQSKKEAYQGDMINATVESIITHYGGLPEDCEAGKINEDIMAEVAKIIPSDQAINLIKQCGYKQSKGKMTQFFKEFTTRHPDLTQVLKSNIVINRATKTDK